MFATIFGLPFHKKTVWWKFDHSSYSFLLMAKLR